jgi:ATP-dependent protease Clp ATPase subunit
MWHDRDAEVLRCSFCGKSQDIVQKLISNPSDHPKRAYICDECVTVCASILEDDRRPQDVGVSNAEADEPNTLLNHPLTPELLAAIELWIKKESLGADAAEEFAKVRATAVRLMRPDSRPVPPK